jgi:very-short-patch-repair endonuclease
MLLTETTVDAESAQPVDGAKVLVDGVGDLSVNDAVMVVKAADRLVGGHEGLDGLIELSLKDVERVTGVVASPFEAQLSLLLATPARVAGGEGLDPFSNNARIVLSGKAARLAGRYNCYADFLFEETGDKKPLVVECQGRLVHSGADAAMSDSDRATALQQMGFNVMLLTYQQIADEKNFEIVKRMLFEEIGLEYREIARRRTQLDAQRSLRRELFIDWNTLGR